MLNLKDIDLLQINSLINKHIKKNLEFYEKSFLLHIIIKHAQSLKIDSIEKYIDFLSGSQDWIEQFIEMLEVNYTDFFRNSLTYAQQEHIIIPELIEKSENNCEIRIWSAGCSTGQEPYSLAILFEDFINKSEKHRNYRIFATDQSDKLIDYAKLGSYKHREIENVKISYLEKYFEKLRNTYVISKKLQKHIELSFFDLLDKNFDFPHESIYGQFNLIICSNVLIYYNFEAQNKIIRKLIDSLSKNGYLIVGETEKHLLNNYQELVSLDLNSSIYRKVLSENDKDKI